MILSLKEWADTQTDTVKEEVEVLNEKQILFNGGKKYGQIVFLAGGAGSGKGFAISNFLPGNDFKIRDVDEWKKAFLKLNQTKGRFPDLGDLNLRNPKDVFKLHMAVKDAGIKDKTLDALLSDVSQDRLPNIIFDITLKEIGDITEVMPKLQEVGYDPKNIHIVWVLTNYRVAVMNNAGRSRVVPEDILLKTHEGAAKTMYQIVTGSIPRGINGKVAVILNNRENTVFFDRPNSKGEKVIKDFTYLTIKQEGKKPVKRKEVQQQVFDWIRSNIPKTKETKELFGK
jgi:hypothetical protein